MIALANLRFSFACRHRADMLRGMEFSLHPRLAAGGFEIARIGKCRLLLKNNALFSWFLLIPEVEAEITELHQLEPERFQEVMEMVRQVSRFVEISFHPEKLNVASIGNQVPQMHIHIVGRNSSDPAWPGTVWAFDGKQSYETSEVERIQGLAKEFFGGI